MLVYPVFAILQGLFDINVFRIGGILVFIF